MTALINSSKEYGVEFIYAISPGLDITFSSSKDIQCLKRKLEQVSVEYNFMELVIPVILYYVSVL